MRYALLLPVCCLTLAAQDGTLNKRIEQIAASAHGRVGVGCALPDEVLDCSFNASDRFPMQSVYKLPIAMATLAAIERGKLSLMQNVRFLKSDLISPGQYSPLRDAHPQAGVDVPIQELIRLAVSESDGVASDILLRTIGGPPVADAYVKSLGIYGVSIKDSEKAIGADVRTQYRNYAEPKAMVALLRLLADHSPLSSQHTDLLLRLMTDTSRGAHRLKQLLPEGTVVAHKAGTSGTEAGITNATNDVGLITLTNGKKLAVAVFVSDSPESESVRESVIARIAREIWQASLKTDQ